MHRESGDYRLILKTALASKGRDREAYSLRAFSEKIGVSTSFLSEVLNAKKSLSMELAFKIAVKLELTESEAQYFCTLVQLENEKDPSFREELLKRLNESHPERRTHDLTADLFRSISDWYHAAILELTQIPGLRLDAEEAAKRLSITKIEAELAIERLLRIELLERDAHKRLRKAHSYLLTEAEIPTLAFKKFHSQVIEKSAKALVEQVPKRRLSASDILAFDSKQFAKVDKLSREFSAAVMKLSEKSKVKDCVYALSVHFFDLTFRGEKAE